MWGQCIEPGNIPGVSRQPRAHDRAVVTERAAALSGRSRCDRMLHRQHVASQRASGCGTRRDPRCRVRSGSVADEGAGARLVLARHRRRNVLVHCGAAFKHPAPEDSYARLGGPRGPLRRLRRQRTAPSQPANREVPVVANTPIKISHCLFLTDPRSANGHMEAPEPESIAKVLAFVVVTPLTRSGSRPWPRMAHDGVRKAS
jgi:hypothetical protein